MDKPSAMSWDLASIRAGLHTARGLRHAAWLTDSQRRPHEFAEALLTAPELDPPLPRKSALDIGIDFYSDLLGAHVQSQNGARKVIEFFDAEPRSLTYRELHRQATAVAMHFAAQQLIAGDPLALVLPLGVELLIALLAGLRLGLHLLIVAPTGPRRLQRQLQALGETPIWTLPRYQRLLGEHTRMVIPRPRPEELLRASVPPPEPEPHTYQPSDPVLSCFSPLHADPDTPAEVSAQRAYVGGLRDSLVLGLRPGTTVWAPLAHPAQHGIALLFAVLHAGATYIHHPAAESGRAPNWPWPGSAEVLLLSGSALPLAESFSSSALVPRRYFVCPFAAQMPGLLATIAEGPLAKVPGSLLHLDTAAGGAILISEPRTGTLGHTVFPAPGVRYQVEDPNRPGQPADGISGRLRLPDLPAAADGALLLSQLDWGYFVAGTLTPRRRGCRYPLPEVEELLAELTELCGALIVESAALPDGRFTVLAFTAGNVTAGALTQRIVWQLGEDARPDAIRILPIYPRRLRAELDRSFYRTCHQSGTLERLTREPALHALSTVRGLVARLRGNA